MAVLHGTQLDWISAMRAWDRCADPDLTIERFAGEPCYIGLDLASKTDMAARVAIFPKVIDGQAHYYLFGRDEGMARAQEHAEADQPGWTEAAATFLRDYAQTVAGPFLVEQARTASKHRVALPENTKAWGPAAVLAVKRGWSVKAGYGPASSSNGSPKTLFRSAP